MRLRLLVLLAVAAALATALGSGHGPTGGSAQRRERVPPCPSGVRGVAAAGLIGEVVVEAHLLHIAPPLPCELPPVDKVGRDLCVDLLALRVPSAVCRQIGAA